MTDVTSRLPDPRARGLRAKIYAGTLLFFPFSGVFVWIGSGAVPLQDETYSPLWLWSGVLLLGYGVAGVTKELNMLRFRADPRPVESVYLDAGERALFIPRNPVPSLVAAGMCCLWALVLGMMGAFVAERGSWPGAAALWLVALLALLVARPHQAREMAGGVWLTPTRVISDHDGVRWEVPWRLIKFGFASQVRFILDTPRGYRVPVEKRPWVWLRKPGYNRFLGSPVLDATDLAVSQELLARVVDKALEDDHFRASLGSSGTLPPM